MQKTTNSFEGILFFIENISMRKMTLEVEYFKRWSQDIYLL